MRLAHYFQIDAALTIDRVLREHVQRLGVPSWRGALLGHPQPRVVLPLGISAELDAAARSLTLLEPAVA